MGNEGMEIKVERIYRFDDDESSLKGFADVSIAGSFMIKGIRIVSGKKGLFVGMPQEQGKNGRWYNRVDLLDDVLRQKLADLVLSSYND